jgi:hypothetical protein
MLKQKQIVRDVERVRSNKHPAIAAEKAVFRESNISK